MDANMSHNITFFIRFCPIFTLCYVFSSAAIATLSVAMCKVNNFDVKYMIEPTKEINIPKVGTPVRGSKTGQPIMVLFDLLGRRWAMGIVWNLNGQTCTFRELQTRCDGLSPTVLNTRLKELRAAAIVEKTPNGYGLTPQGQSLYDLLEPLGDWSYAWTALLDNSTTD